MMTLPNGNSIDLDMLEVALEDSDPTHRYFLNLVTGEVVFISDDQWPQAWYQWKQTQLEAAIDEWLKSVL
jgi:hypothetical protein